MRRAVAAGAAWVVVVLAVAGCSGSDDPDMPGLTGSPTATSAPTETPTPSQTPTSIAGTVVDLSDPELGIVFEDVPELSGDEADVYNWLSTFEVEYWRTLLDGAVSPGLEVFTAPETMAELEQMTANNVVDGAEFGGTFRATVGDVHVDGDTATGTTCDDYRGVTVADSSGPLTLEEEGMDTPILIEYSLVRHPTAAGVWIVGESRGLGTC